MEDIRELLAELLAELKAGNAGKADADAGKADDDAEKADDDAEKADAEKADAEKADELARANDRIAVLEASIRTGVPPELLAGPGGDYAAYAAALVDWASSRAPAAQGLPAPAVPERIGSLSLDEQIAAAHAAGDEARVRMLKAMQLGS